MYLQGANKKMDHLLDRSIPFLTSFQSLKFFDRTSQKLVVLYQVGVHSDCQDDKDCCKNSLKEGKFFKKGVNFFVCILYWAKNDIFESQRPH